MRISATVRLKNELALKTWEVKVFHQKLDGSFAGRRPGMMELVASLSSEKFLCERKDHWWMEGDDGSQPLICMALGDADNLDWWNTVLPTLRRWLKSD